MKDDPMDITDMKDMNTAKLREVIAHEESGDALIEWAADEIERLQAARHADSQRILKMSDEYEAAQDEIERLREKLIEARADRWHKALTGREGEQ
jgi:hypothetical protein